MSQECMNLLLLLCILQIFYNDVNSLLLNLMKCLQWKNFNKILQLSR